jgi:DNA-binding NarL/FixJ family response regulator
MLNQSINVSVLHQNALFRQGLIKLMSQIEGIHVVSQGAVHAEVIQHDFKDDTHVVLLDISLSERGGIDTLKYLKSQRKDLHVLMLGKTIDTRDVTLSLKHGAAGFLSNDTQIDEVVRAIRIVAQHKKYVTPQIAELLAEHIAADVGDDPLQSLSDREMQTFTMMAKGYTLMQIAKKLSLSVKTISTYRSRIFEKMHFKTNAELMYFGINNKLI